MEIRWRGLFLACCFVSSATTQHAHAVTWATATSGNWSTAARWSTGFVPNHDGTPVTIDATGVDYTVTLDSFRFASSLTINSVNATFNHTNSTLDVNQINVINGQYRLNGGTIAGAIINPNNFVIINGMMFGCYVDGDLNLDDRDPSSLTFKAGTGVAGTINISNNGLLRMDQDFVVESGKTLTLGSSDATTGGTIENPSAGLGTDRSFTIESGATIAQNRGLVRDMQVTNNGTINANTDSFGGYSGSRSTLQNNGQINVSNQHQFGIANLNNKSDINVTDKGRLTLEGSYDNTNGHINIDSTSELTLRDQNISKFGNVNLQSGGTVYMRGLFTNDVGTFAPGAGWVVDGRITGGTVDATGLYFLNTELQDTNVVGDLHVAFGHIELETGATISSSLIDINAGDIVAMHGFTLESGQTISLGRDPLFTGQSRFTVYQGQMTFDAGSNIIGGGIIHSVPMNSQIILDGTISPGNTSYPIRTIDMFGHSIVFGSTAITEIQLGIDGIDRVNANLLGTLGGQLKVSLLDGFVPTVGQEYTFLAFNAYTGTFDGLQDGDLVGHFGNRDLHIRYTPNAVSLYAVAVPEPSSMALIAAAGSLAIYMRRKNRSKIASSLPN